MLKRGVFLLLLILFAGCGNGHREETLATVGKVPITVTDFVQRAELSPLPPHIDIRTIQGKKEALDLLIAEKLFAREAQKHGLADDVLFQRKMAFIQKAAVGRELYRDEVSSVVQVSDEEIRNAFDRMNETLSVRFVQTPHQEMAALWKQALDQGLPFEALLDRIHGEPVTSEMQRIDFKWGQTDPVIEEAAYSMQPGDVSPVLPVSNGFLILKLENRIREKMPTESNFAERKQTVEKMIRRRKEAVRSGHFVEHFMKDKNVVLKADAFNRITKELEKRIHFNESGQNGLKNKMLLKREVNRVEDDLSQHLKDPLITFQGGEWTIGDFLERLWMQEVPVNHVSPGQFRKELKESIRLLVRDEFLAEEGMKRGLSKRENVRRDIDMWRDNFLYVMMKNEYTDPYQKYLELSKKYAIEVDSVRLRNVELTHVPMVSLWTNVQRQLVVPIWPHLEK